MGFIEGFMNGLFGKKDSAQSIKARMAKEASNEILNSPKIASALMNIVQNNYEHIIPKLVYRLGNSMRHHAGAVQGGPEHQKIRDADFLQPYIEGYWFEFYKLGHSIGHQAAIGQADENYQKEIGILCKDVNDRMVNEAGRTFSNQKLIECFIITGKEAFDLGGQDGANLGSQDYIYVPK